MTIDSLFTNKRLIKKDWGKAPMMDLIFEYIFEKDVNALEKKDFLDIIFLAVFPKEA